MPFLIAALFGYLLGSIPFGLLITRAAGLGDVRSIGSGNIGATNVLRTGRRGLAAATLLLDALKGTAAVLIANRWGLELGIAAGFLAFIGHLFPVWLGFRGGKGVATYLGVLAAFAWQGALVFAVAWLATAFLTRFSSLAALVAAVAVPVALAALGKVDYAVVMAVMSVIVLVKHRANIARLLAGTEFEDRIEGVSEAPSGSPRLSDRQRLNWLRLIRTDNVGPATFRDLINRFGSAEAALEFLPELAAKGGAARMPRIPRMADAEREMDACRAAGARFVALGESDYPPMLKRMDLPPPLIAVKGETAVAALTAIGIVGARNASTAGVRMARVLAGEMGRAGIAIVSGLARGIDAAAHGASLDTGTIAVLAGGIDKPYPQENLALCGEIGERGCLISEMPFGWEPRARDFPRRNRLIAGLSLGVVVVEAAKRSGSLITARLANEMGRLVFAVPGSPLDPRAEGANGLLKQGAMLVTEAADVLEAIAPLTGASMTGGSLNGAPPTLSEPPDFGAVPPPGETERDRVLEALSPVPTPVDEIIRHTGLHPAQLFMILLELDLAGRLERHPGGSVSLRVPDP